jgi:hypothetical protein
VAGKRAVIREITTEIMVHPARSTRAPASERIEVTWREYWRVPTIDNLQLWVEEP